MIYLGSHVSFKAPHYLFGSIQESLSYGANACMIYTGAPSNTKRVSADKFQIEKASNLMKQTGFDAGRIIVHAPYLINLANTVQPDLFDFGVRFLQSEVQRTARLGASTLVLHPGCHLKAGLAAGIDQIVKGLNQVLDADSSSVRIALETMAGKGTEIGFDLEQLQLILERVHRPDRIGFCLDTCHLHDAGYDLQDTEGLLETIDSQLDLKRILVIHVNDSKNIRDSHKDRHANIGKGYIGLAPLARIVHHPALQGITKILETPYIEKRPPYKEEIALLRKSA